MANFTLQQHLPLLRDTFQYIFLNIMHREQNKNNCTSRHIIVGQKRFIPEIRYLGLELQMSIHHTCTQRQQIFRNFVQHRQRLRRVQITSESNPWGQYICTL